MSKRMPRTERRKQLLRKLALRAALCRANLALAEFAQKREFTSLQRSCEEFAANELAELARTLKLKQKPGA